MREGSPGLEEFLISARQPSCWLALQPHVGRLSARWLHRHRPMVQHPPLVPLCRHRLVRLLRGCTVLGSGLHHWREAVLSRHMHQPARFSAAHQCATRYVFPAPQLSPTTTTAATTKAAKAAVMASYFDTSKQGVLSTLQLKPGSTRQRVPQLLKVPPHAFLTWPTSRVFRS